MTHQLLGWAPPIKYISISLCIIQFSRRHDEPPPYLEHGGRGDRFDSGPDGVESSVELIDLQIHDRCVIRVPVHGGSSIAPVSAIGKVP